MGREGVAEGKGNLLQASVSSPAGGDIEKDHIAPIGG
jgi:hypothetical protein